MFYIKTEQGYRYEIILADAEANNAVVDPTTQPSKATFKEEELVYFIRLADFFKAISAEKLDTGDMEEVDLDRDCPLYVLRNGRFEQLGQLCKRIGSQTAASLYIRYDQCFEMAHTWLEQMMMRRSKGNKDVASWIKQVTNEMYNQMDYAAVVEYVQRLERACFEVADPNAKKKDPVVATEMDYRLVTAKIAEFLYAQKLTYRTLQQAKHPISYLEDMPLVNFILEGFLLFATPEFNHIRRPFWQKTIFLPKFNAYLAENNLVMEPEEMMKWSAFSYSYIFRKKTLVKKTQQAKQ